MYRRALYSVLLALKKMSSASAIQKVNVVDHSNLRYVISDDSTHMKNKSLKRFYAQMYIRYEIKIH